MNLSDFFGSNNAEWMEDPNRPCAIRDPEWWFDPAADLHTEAKRKPRGWAAELCAGCPVVNQCLQYALDNREQWGVWGGMTAPERVLLVRKGAAA